MLFTDKTIDKCVDKIKNNEIIAVLFTGNNYGLANILSDKIEKDFQQEEKILIDFQDDTKEKSFLQELRLNLQNDFFSKKKLVKVYNIKSKKGISKSLEFLENEDFTDKLILLFGNEIDKKCELKTFFEKGNKLACVNLYEDDEKTAIEVITQYYLAHNMKIDVKAIKIMAEKLHGDRLSLLYECEKILYYCNFNDICVDDVEKAIESEQTSNPILFTDYLLSGNLINAVKEFELLEKDDIQMILFIRMFIKLVDELLLIKQETLNGIEAETAIKARFLFWKRIPFVKIIISKTTIQMLENYIKIALQTEKIAKIHGNDISKQYFIRNAILYNIR